MLVNLLQMTTDGLCIQQAVLIQPAIVVPHAAHFLLRVESVINTMYGIAASPRRAIAVLLGQFPQPSFQSSVEQHIHCTMSERLAHSALHVPNNV